MAAGMAGLAGCNGPTRAGGGAEEPSREAAGGTGHETGAGAEPDHDAGAGAPAAASAETLVLSAEEQQAAGIRVQAVAAERLPGQLTVTGTVAPVATRIARVAPQVAGRLQAIAVTPGTRVRAGQLLATLQSPELEALHASQRNADTDLQLAQAHFARMEALVRDDGVARKDWLNAGADLERARSAATAAHQRLRLLGADGSGDDSSYRLVAPLAGTVTEQQAVQGELADPGHALFTIADLASVWVEAEVHEQELAELRIGAAATVAVAAWPGRVFAGRLGYLASSLDAQTHTLKARIEVRNPDQALKLGMLATVTLTGASTAPRMAVPADAVVLVHGQPAVFRRDGTRFAAVPVTTGARVGGRVVIADGIRAGDPIVVAGAYPLKARLLKSSIGDTD